MRAALTVLLRYRLTGTADAYRAAIAALAERVEREGARGVLGYRHFFSEEAGEARSVVDYKDGAAWVEHHHIAFGWPQMKALQAVATLEEVHFLGEPGEAVWHYLETSPLKDKIRAGYPLAAGFERSGS